MKRKIFWLVLIALSLFGHYKYFGMKRVESQPFLHEVGVRCGVVVSTFTELRNVKHGSTTEYYLMVKYGTDLVVENVTPKTWYGTKEGSEICFSTTDSVSILLILNLVATFIFLVFVAIFIFGTFIRWVFDWKPYSMLKI